MTAACLLTLQLFAAVNLAEDSPDAYAKLDQWLSAHSAKYKTMADAVRKRRTYRIIAADDFLGNVRDDEKGIVIELSPRLPKERRATILIWEMSNAYQRETFAEISRRARAGEITSSREFGLRMEMVEYGSHQHHLEVMRELEQAGVPVGADFFFFLDLQAKSLKEYRIPPPHDYLDANGKSGHTKHYEDWYYKVIGKEPPKER